MMQGLKRDEAALYETIKSTEDRMRVSEKRRDHVEAVKDELKDKMHKI